VGENAEIKEKEQELIKKNLKTSPASCYGKGEENNNS